MQQRISQSISSVFLSCAFLLSGVGASCLAADTIELQNPGFEDGESGWNWSKEDKESSLSTILPDAAHAGKTGLRVLVKTGEDAPAGSSVQSTKYPAQPGDTYELKFFARSTEKSGIGVIILFFNDKYSICGDAKLIMPMEVTDWVEYKVSGKAPDNTAYVAIYIHSWSKNRCNIDFDDFTLTKVVKP